MTIGTLQYFLLASSLLVTCIDPWTLGSDQPPTVEVRVERNERINHNEVHFRVRVTNTSKQAVFLTGIIYESRSLLDPVYLEQQRVTGDWKIVVPCMDTPPPHVIKLDPAEPTIEDLVLKVPLERVCKERNIQLEGKFRFRVNYFEREEQARAYLKNFFSKGGQEAHTAVALSEPFEISPLRDPAGGAPLKP